MACCLFRQTSRSKGEQSGHTFFVWQHQCLATCLVVVYLIIGMFIFNVIEAPYERKQYEVEVAAANCSSTLVENVTIDLRKATANQFNSNSVQKDLLSAVNIVSFKVDLASSKLTVYYVKTACVNPPVPSDKWNLAGAMLFCVTIVTTIGYGTLAPATNLGKGVFVLYASFGMPLFAISTENLRNLIVAAVVSLEGKLSKSFKKLKRKSKNGDDNETPNCKDAASLIKNPTVSLFLVLFLGYSLFTFAPAGLFTYMEGWSYLDSLYYNYVSLSTIGFGDMVAANNRHGEGVRYSSEAQYVFYRLFLAFWLFFGIAFAGSLLDMWRNRIEAFLQLSCFKCTSAMPFSSESNSEVSSQKSRKNSLDGDAHVGQTNAK